MQQPEYMLGAVALSASCLTLLVLSALGFFGKVQRFRRLCWLLLLSAVWCAFEAYTDYLSIYEVEDHQSAQVKVLSLVGLAGGAALAWGFYKSRSRSKTQDRPQ